MEFVALVEVTDHYGNSGLLHCFERALAFYVVIMLLLSSTVISNQHNEIKNIWHSPL